MARVLVLEKPRANIDVSRALEFGDIVYVFGLGYRRCSVFECDEFGKAVLEQLEAIAYDPAVDMLCVAGSMVPVTVAVAAVLCRYHVMNILLYNAASNSYVCRVMRSDSWNGRNANAADKHKV